MGILWIGYCSKKPPKKINACPVAICPLVPGLFLRRVWFWGRLDVLGVVFLKWRKKIHSQKASMFWGNQPIKRGDEPPTLQLAFAFIWGRGQEWEWERDSKLIDDKNVLASLWRNNLRATVSSMGGKQIKLPVHSVSVAMAAQTCMTLLCMGAASNPPPRKWGHIKKGGI